MSASTRQRREQILRDILETRHVTVVDLAASKGVSEATIRRDLSALAAEGQVDLVYGGATVLKDAEYSFRTKCRRNIEAKRIVARLAANLVQDNDQIFLDAGTTCFEMIPFLKRKRGLSIVLNSARLALEIDMPGVEVILIGGQYRADRIDTIGPLAAAMMDQLRGYLAFISADGLSMDFGPAAADIDSAHLNRLAALNARDTILVADHTKFEIPSLFKIVDWDKISRVVTDVAPSPEWSEFLRSKEILVICPEAAASPEALSPST
jgi:DeoR/GlpR family transcriptional regulator of sugar metabolism